MKISTAFLPATLCLFGCLTANSIAVATATATTATTATMTGKLRGMPSQTAIQSVYSNNTTLTGNDNDNRALLLQQDSISRTLQSATVSDILPSPATFFGGNGGNLFSHDAAVLAGKITKVTLFAGRLVDGIQITYADGRTFSAGGRGGTRRTLNLDNDEHIIQVRGRSASKVDRLEFVTNKGNRIVGGGGGGAAFDTGVFPDGSVLQHLRGKAGRLIDAIAFVLVPAPPEALELEVTTRVGQSFGGGGGTSFSDFDTFFDDNILKIQSITVYSGSRVDGLEVDYLTENGIKTVLHGQKGGNKENRVTFDDAALKEIFLSAGSRVDQITFVNTRGRSFGPFGGTGGTLRSLSSGEGEVILSLFGRDGSELDQLGAVFATGAIDRVEITGPFAFTPTFSDVNVLSFPEQSGSVLELQNCDPDSVTDVTGKISFTQSVTTTETFTQSSTSQTSFEVSVSTTTEIFGQETEIAVTVGTSFEETKEFGQEFSDTVEFGFDSTIVAKPGFKTTATALYSELEFAFDFKVPVNIFFAADPDTAVADTFEGVLEGVTANNGRISQVTDPCE